MIYNLFADVACNIRPAHVRDEPELSDLFIQLMDDMPFLGTQLRSGLIRSFTGSNLSYFFKREGSIALLGEDIRGMAGLAYAFPVTPEHYQKKGWDAPSHSLWLACIGVRPDLRSRVKNHQPEQSLGDILLNKAICGLKEDQQFIETMALVENHDAHRLFIRNGFDIAGHVRGKITGREYIRYRLDPQALMPGAKLSDHSIDLARLEVNAANFDVPVIRRVLN